MSDKKVVTKVLYNKGSRTYTYRGLDGKTEKLLPGKIAKMDADVADMLLSHGDVEDTENRAAPAKTVEDIQKVLDDANKRINELEVELKDALEKLDKKSKKEKE